MFYLRQNVECAVSRRPLFFSGCEQRRSAPGRGSRSRLFTVEAANSDFAEPDFFPVVLECDVAAPLPCVAGHVLELARGDEGPQRVAAQVVLDDLPPVEPVLDLPAAYDQPSLVELAGRAQSLIRRRDEPE